MQMDALEEDDIEVLKKLFAGSITQSLSSLFFHSKLDLPTAKINDTCSSVLGDGFYFMDRVKVPMHHSF